MSEKERMTQVQNQIADLEEAIQHLQSNITTLTTSLHPILTEDTGPETAVVVPLDSGDPLVPLANDLHLLERLVLAQADRVAMLTKRSEL